MVNIIFGGKGIAAGGTAGATSSGLTYVDLSYSQNNSSISGLAESGDRFGASLAVGKFDSDCNDDLAIGIPGEDLTSINGNFTGDFSFEGPDEELGEEHNFNIKNFIDAGMVVVLRDIKASGAVTSQVFHQDIDGIEGVVESGDQFGSTLVAGNFDSKNGDDLAIGAIGEAIGSKNNAGAINLILSSSSTLDALQESAINQDQPKVRGRSEANDMFSAALAMGDIDNDGTEDLIIGLPGQDSLASNKTLKIDAGSILVVYGDLLSSAISKTQLWDQNSSR